MLSQFFTIVNPTQTKPQSITNIQSNPSTFSYRFKSRVSIDQHSLKQLFGFDHSFLKKNYSVIKSAIKKNLKILYVQKSYNTDHEQVLPLPLEIDFIEYRQNTQSGFEIYDFLIKGAEQDRLDVIDTEARQKHPLSLALEDNKTTGIKFSFLLPGFINEQTKNILGEILYNIKSKTINIIKLEKSTISLKEQVCFIRKWLIDEQYLEHPLKLQQRPSSVEQEIDIKQRN
ncbi:hypothetical protein CDIK_1236 [Cucumispora dikerogammari]|nr:hypothetical protein CDIK_1236 [Cucumispora dikerogammari]